MLTDFDFLGFRKKIVPDPFMSNVSIGFVKSQLKLDQWFQLKLTEVEGAADFAQKQKRNETVATHDGIEKEETKKWKLKRSFQTKGSDFFWLRGFKKGSPI